MLTDDDCPGAQGLTSHKDVIQTLLVQKNLHLKQRQIEDLDTQENILRTAIEFPHRLGVGTNRATAAEAATKQTRSDPAATGLGTPRNGPCPCGSGQKHKRCCGKNAPAVVTRAA